MAVSISSENNKKKKNTYKLTHRWQASCNTCEHCPDFARIAGEQINQKQNDVVHDTTSLRNSANDACEIVVCEHDISSLEVLFQMTKKKKKKKGTKQKETSFVKSVPVIPIATPTSACRIAGASLTPSPVMETTS
jgi:hypothetical protein